jgi:hypothetical protein
MTAFRWTWGILTAVIALVIVVIVCWQAGWWFTAHNVQRGYSVTVQSQQFQTSLDAEMAQNIANISPLATERQGIATSSPEQVTIRASELNQLTLFCREGLQLVNNNPGYASLEQTYTANCAAGAPTIDPPLANPVPPTGGQ